jgi:hypothetical protein
MKEIVNKRIGEIHIVNFEQKLEIIEYYGTNNITVKFEDGTILNNISYGHIKDGKVKNPMRPNLHGFGFIGVGKHVTILNSEKTIKYVVWCNMLNRVFSKSMHKARPTYIGTQIFKGWANFQTFGDWFDENYVDGFVLDKDILVKGNKAYHPLRCCFVPQEINQLFVKNEICRGKLPIGVSKDRDKFKAQLTINGKQYCFGGFLNIEDAFEKYKEQKEANIRNYAKLWKDKLPKNVYDAIIVYTVEITD